MLCADPLKVKSSKLLSLWKWTVMYFGFTHCPDICQDELQKLVAAINKIKQKSGIDILLVFISFDPERDNVEKVRECVKEQKSGIDILLVFISFDPKRDNVEKVRECVKGAFNALFGYIDYFKVHLLVLISFACTFRVPPEIGWVN
ncbi:hypothetical protein ACFE04_021991 [Oxalis oulophora]